MLQHWWPVVNVGKVNILLRYGADPLKLGATSHRFSLVNICLINLNFHAYSRSVVVSADFQITARPPFACSQVPDMGMGRKHVISRFVPHGKKNKERLTETERETRIVNEW